MTQNSITNPLVDKWSPILEGIEDNTVRENTAVLLENQARNVVTEAAKDGSLNEASTTVGNLGTFQKFAFPLVRRVFPELIANKVVGVQPMQGPVSQVFYLGYDRSSDSTTQSVYNKYNMTYRGLDASATSPAGGLGGNSLDDAFNVSSGVSWSSGDFSGNIANTFGKEIAAFPSATAINGWSTSAGEGLGDSGNAPIPDISFHIEQQAVIAGTRKFRALWTIEAAQDLKAYHNLELERELTELLSNELKLEIDRELLEDLRMIAYDISGTDYSVWNRSKLDLGNPNAFPGSTGWQDGTTHQTDWNYNFTNGTNNAGGLKNVYFVDLATSAMGLAPRHVGEAYSNLLAAVNFAAQDIYKTTLRGAGNYLITSPIVAAMLHSASKLEGGMSPESAGSLGANVTYKGKWMGQYDVYVDPLWPEDEILIGYKGKSAMDAGYVYSPYIPLQTLPTVVDPNTFQPRKGILTRYGKTAITPEARFYRIIRLVGADSRFLVQPFARIADAYASRQ